MNIIQVICVFLVGLAFGIFGYRYFRFLVVVLCAVAGACAGYTIGMFTGAGWLAICLAVIGGGAGILVSSLMVRQALFFYGISVGWGFGAFLGTLFAVQGPWSVFLKLVCAVAAGALAVRARRALMVLGTSILGATLCAESLFVLVLGWSRAAGYSIGNSFFLMPVGDPRPDASPLLFVAVWAVLTGVFAALQYRIFEVGGKSLQSGAYFETDNQGKR